MIIRIHFPMPKFRAITLGPIIIIFRDEDDRLLKHESCHLKQFKRDPILFYPKYLLEFARNYLKYRDWMTAYRNISYELEAKASERS